MSKGEKVWFKWSNGQIQRFYIYSSFKVGNETWFRAKMGKRNMVLKEKDYGITWSKNKEDLLKMKSLKSFEIIKTMYETFIKKVSGNEKEELNYAERQDFEIIEKYLKAFEIIKEKEVNISALLELDNLQLYNDY